MNATSMYKFQTNMSDQIESALPPSNLLWIRDTHEYSENGLSDQWSNPTQTQGSAISCSSISDIEGAEWPPPHLSGSICSTSDVNDQFEKLAANLGQEVFASSNGVVESDQNSSNHINGSSLLLGEGGTEALQNLERYFFEDAVYSSRPSNQAENYQLPELGLRNSEDTLSWDFSEKNLGLELESDANLVSGQAQYAFPLLDADMSAWCSMDQTQKHPLGGLPIQDFSSLPALDFSISNRSHQDSAKIKQETDLYFSNSCIGKSSFFLQNLGSEAYRDGSMKNILGQPFRSSLNLKDMGCLHYPVRYNEVSSRWVPTSGRLPAMLSQLLPGSSSKHANFHGGCTSRSYLDYNNMRLDHHNFLTARSDYSCFTDNSFAQHIPHEVKLDPHSNASRRNMGYDTDEGGEIVLDSSRRSTSSTNELTTQTYFKRPRLQQTSNPPFKIVQPRKEKFSERIKALQQLVAPFGKTYTASVLTEAIAHIKHTHDQLKNFQEAATRNFWSSDKAKDEEFMQDLQSRGLCLVPLSWASQVASDNVTEYNWTPMHLGRGIR